MRRASHVRKRTTLSRAPTSRPLGRQVPALISSPRQRVLRRISHIFGAPLCWHESEPCRGSAAISSEQSKSAAVCEAQLVAKSTLPDNHLPNHGRTSSQLGAIMGEIIRFISKSDVERA